MTFPTADPQFWIVTAAVALAAAWLLRGLLPIPYLSRRHRARRHQRRVNLTIGGKSPR